jgi:sugar-specific transcriptional regulator TrmB
MDELTNHQRAVESLQQLGLKEYEAKSFVALSRIPQGTAKEIHEISDVPRTRVYDAARALEERGLVEIQHSNPQRFRAVPIEEAVETLREQYDSRAATLREALRGLDPVETDAGEAITHQVWALSGATAVANRTVELIETADSEVVLVVGDDATFTDELADGLRAAEERGVDVVVGTVSEALRERIRAALPEAAVFVSELDWLRGLAAADDETVLSRLLLVDRESILVSTLHEDASGAQTEERAVFGTGFDNGIVVVARRLMATGLLPGSDPQARSN